MFDSLGVKVPYQPDGGRLAKRKGVANRELGAEGRVEQTHASMHKNLDPAAHVRTLLELLCISGGWREPMAHSRAGFACSIAAAIHIP